MQQKINHGLPAASQNNWEYLFEAALLEPEPTMIERATAKCKGRHHGSNRGFLR